MPRVRRSAKRTGEVVSQYRFCPVDQMRVHVAICEKRCEDMNCPISRAKMEKKWRRNLQARARRKKKKIEAEQKKLDEQGLTRNLLLRPEDRIKED